VIEVNEYFEGKVKSLAVNSSAGKKTVGVMEPGEYEFDAQTKETMTVISGEFSVYLAEYDEWEDFGVGSTFDVPAQSKLKVKVAEDTAYLCEYESE
jgi:hypothetical protein